MGVGKQGIFHSTINGGTKHNLDKSHQKVFGILYAPKLRLALPCLNTKLYELGIEIILKHAHIPYATINIMPYYPLPGQMMGIVCGFDLLAS